jgi:hypothetical protein
MIAGKYLIEGDRRRIGISDLFDAQDQQLERPLTIQILAGKESSHQGTCDTFLRHQRIASSIQDGALFAVYDAGIWEGRAFSVMQRFTGVQAQDLYTPNRPPDVPLALSATRQVAEGLERCRQAGLADWAFSPEAVLVDSEGNAHLAIIEGLTALDGVGDAAALGRLLRLMLAGNPDASSAQLRSALVPEVVIGLLERLESGQNNGMSSAGDAAAAIAAIEAASMQPTQDYAPNARAIDDTAPDSDTRDFSEAPTLVAPILQAAGLPPQDAIVSAPSGLKGSPPPAVRATMSFGSSAPGVGALPGTSVRRERRRPAWLVPGSVLLLVLALGFVWLKLLGPASKVEGQIVLPTVTPTAVPTAPARVAVPDLRGKSLDEAVSIVQASRLSLMQGSSVYNADYSAGQITGQQPAPGTQVQAGSIITINLSLGQAPTRPVVSNPPAPPTPNSSPGNDRGRGKHK